MEYGLCILPVVPMRSESNEKAEQCTQLLFGDFFTVLESDESRSYVELYTDSYHGWVDKKQYIPISREDFFLLSRAKPLYCADFINPITITNTATNQTFTSRLPFACCLFSKHYSIGNYIINASQITLLKPQHFTPERLEEYISRFLYTPYIWGGRSNFATDCSGFTQSIFKLFGIKLQRDASQQIKQGTPISELQSAKVGDLAFFSNSEGKIVHVGILLEDNKIVHASGYVRIDTIDPKGILRQEDNTYSHSLHSLRRYF